MFSELRDDQQKRVKDKIKEFLSTVKEKGKGHGVKSMEFRAKTEAFR